MNATFENTPEYRNWQWRVATNIRNALEATYVTHPDEVKAVQAITEAGSREPSLSSLDTMVHLESAFIHGARSQVAFLVGGESHQCEVGDLLVIGTYIEENRMRWQRVCFIQAKRSSAGGRTSPSRFAIDKWQLALLRAFPEFTGVTGIFQGQRHQLRNISGMLGAYGLLASPGEFSIVSARVLDHVLGGRKSLTAKELVPAFLSDKTIHEKPSTNMNIWWPYDPEHCPECREFFEHFFPFRHHWHHHQHHHRNPLGIMNDAIPDQSVLSCIGIDAFVQSWTSLRLGEVWHPGTRINSDRALAYVVWQAASYVLAQTEHSGSLDTLMDVLRRVEAGSPPNRNVSDQSIGPTHKGALGILSATVTRSRQKERKG